MENPNTNYGNAGNESLTDLRRRYPKDTQGIKDEWRAVIRHQTELNEVIAKREKELRGLKQQELGNAYDHKLQDQIKAKEYELMLKQREADEVQLKVNRYHEDVMKQKEDKNLIRQHLSDDYNNKIMTKAQIEQYQREMKLQEENALIEESKRRLEEAKRRQLAKQQEHYEIFNNEIRRAEEKNHRLLEDKIKEKLDYRDQIKDLEKQQILKEENYKNFFKLSVENQKQLMDLHAKNVLIPHIEKEKGFEQVVEKRIDEARERQLAEEIARRRAREGKAHEVGNHNRDKRDYKDYAKNIERMEKEALVPERLKQSQEYSEFLNSMKSDKLEKQKNYKEFLDKQMASQAERELLNKMTKNEKKLNRNDLQAYKGFDPAMDALIPGFQSSKYADPRGQEAYILKAAGKPDQVKNMYNSMLGRTEQRNSATVNDYSSSPTKADNQPIQNLKAESSVDSPYKSNNYQPEYNNVQSLSSSPARERQYELRQQQQYEQERPQPVQTQFQEARQQQAAPSYNAASPSYNNASSPQFMPSNTYGGFSSPHQSDGYAHKSMADMGSYFKKSHNPITNPLPVNVQNPYIAKEMSRVIQKQPYFASMASNNLIG